DGRKSFRALLRKSAGRCAADARADRSWGDANFKDRVPQRYFASCGDRPIVGRYPDRSRRPVTTSGTGTNPKTPEKHNRARKGDWATGLRCHQFAGVDGPLANPYAGGD